MNLWCRFFEKCDCFDKLYCDLESNINEGNKMKWYPSNTEYAWYTIIKINIQGVRFINSPILFNNSEIPINIVYMSLSTMKTLSLLFTLFSLIQNNSNGMWYLNCNIKFLLDETKIVSSNKKKILRKLLITNIKFFSLLIYKIISSTSYYIKPTPEVVWNCIFERL